MVSIHLSQKEKSELETRHKKCRDKRECDRIKAVLLCHEGWSSHQMGNGVRHIVIDRPLK